MAPPSDRSQRVHARTPAALVVTFRLAGKAAFIERYASNVSAGGIFIVSREVHPVGSEIRFEIRSVDGGTVFTGRGIVRWTKLHDPATKQLPGLGIQFTDLDDENRAILEKITSLQAESLTTPAELPSFSSPSGQLATPLENSADMHREGASAGPTWPQTVPSVAHALPIINREALAPAELLTASEQFLNGLSVEEKSAFQGRWPAELSNRFRATLATQWRLAMAIRSRPPGAEANSAALDQLFAEADEALATVNELSESLVPEVRAGCAHAKVSLARLVQELLPTSDAAAIAADLAASEQTKRQTQPVAPAPVAAVVAEKKPTTERFGFLKRLGPKAAMGFASVSLVMALITAYSVLAPPKVIPLPSLPTLPAGTTVLGNAESGQVIVQRTNNQPFDAETVDAVRKSAEGKGIRVVQLGPTQLMIEVQQQK